MAMSTPEFVSSTLLRICDPDPSSYGSDFSNLCAVMKLLPSTARTYVIGHGIDGKYIPIMARLAKARRWSKR